MKINITKVCKDANWHLRTAIDELSKHLSWEEAESFVEFVFADYSCDMGGDPINYDEEGRAEDQVTDEQWDRLELDGTDWCIKNERRFEPDPDRIQILCGCGWGNLLYEIREGDQPQCPQCGHLFPPYEKEDE